MDSNVTTITREGCFEYAHRLLHHKGACHNLHGHSGRYEVEVTGPVNPVTGMIVDFTDLKKSISQTEEAFDHSLLLNDGDIELRNLLNGITNIHIISGEPTAENISRYWFQRLALILPLGIKVVRVTIWETAKNSATYRG